MRHRILVPTRDNPAVMLELDAIPAGDGQFRLTGLPPNGERMQFRRGEVVECTICQLPSGLHGLVATNSASTNPAFRTRRGIYAVLGAVIGLFVGASAALQIHSTQSSLIVGSVVGSVVFAFFSARWGDAAWKVLVRHAP